MSMVFNEQTILRSIFIITHQHVSLEIILISTLLTLLLKHSSLNYHLLTTLFCINDTTTSTVLADAIDDTTLVPFKVSAC